MSSPGLSAGAAAAPAFNAEFAAAIGEAARNAFKAGDYATAADLNTVYRHDEERGPITLRATPLAYSTLGITDEQDETPPVETPTAPVQRRKGTKQETLIEMLRAEGGATVDEIVAATGWQAHTVRGAMSGALKKKLGLTITSEKVEGRGRAYVIDDD